MFFRRKRGKICRVQKKAVILRENNSRKRKVERKKPFLCQQLPTIRQQYYISQKRPKKNQKIIILSQQLPTIRQQLLDWSKKSQKGQKKS